MITMLSQIKEHAIAEYVVIGAGPAAICAIPNILKNRCCKKRCYLD